MAVDIIARGIAGAAQVGLAQANERIDRLEGKTTRLLYTASTDPTASDINSFVEGLGYTSPFEGIAVVIAGTYHIWHYYENDGIGWRDDGVDTITPFTNSIPGSILGSNDDGKISANNDGTGSVNGWNDKLNSIAAALAYDNTKAYTVDEICTYNGHLYICIQNTTAGTLPTDTTYWEEISVIQLINDFKLALRDGSFIVEKANNSNSSLSTKAIDPISEESGTIHEVPFISQGTGTANNTASVDTSPVAKQLEKQGYTVASNQLVQNGDFASTNNWGTENSNFSVSGNVGTFTATAVNGAIKQTRAIKTGHKYLIATQIKLTTATTSVYLELRHGGGLSSIATQGTTNWQIVSGIISATGSDYEEGYIRIRDARSSDWDAIQVKNAQLYDLTRYFNGNSNIPQDLLDHPDYWSWYDNGTGAYDTGTLKNGNGRYLVCTQGKDGGHSNLWDEQTELGYINTDGEERPSTNEIRSKNYIYVVPNKDIYVKAPNGLGLRFFDKDKNYVSNMQNISNTYVTVPANARFLRFNLNQTYGTTYHNDITISLYYSPEQGGEGYDQYYPYVEPNVYDTGTEELLAFDTKDPDGTIHRNTGIETDLSQSGFTYAAGYVSAAIDAKAGVSVALKGITTLDLPIVSFNDFSNYPYPNGIASNNNGVFIRKQGLSSTEEYNAYLSGKSLQYELATPTTEQGTSFPENIGVNDYGMMYWLDTDGNLVSIPQGCKLFYPVDYVLYLDTLVSHTGGDATSLVRWSDMATQSEIDEILDLI